MELAWAGPGGDPCALTVPAPEGVHAQLASAIRRVLASRRTEHLADVDPAAPALSAVGQVADLPQPDFDLRNVVVIPLLARGRALGVLTLAMGPSGRRYSPSDLALAEDLAGRAAIAMDNSRLYGNVREADRHKNEFLSMLAHELRNPLAPIRNAVHILRLRGGSGPETHALHDLIDRQVQQLVRLVDDLLDLSRITRGKIRLQTEVADMAGIVARAVETSRPLLDARRHDLTVSLPPEPLRLHGDPVRLAQVLSNLLNNSAKYTEEGGRVWLTVERKEAEPGDGAAPSWVEMRVRDTGVGIPPEMLASIFDLFTQVDHSLDRSQGGLGIGLTLVHRLVEMHGGRVQAFSGGPGQGSEFIVRLPALAAEPAGPNGAARQPGRPRRCRVLVVDDNVDGAESLALLLRVAGHDVRISHNGPAGLTEAAAFHPEVVLLDIGLPGMDGYEVARRLQEQPDLPRPLLVAVTGYGQDEAVRRSRAAGFDHHIVKPADPAALASLFASLPAPAAGAFAPIARAP
jgi:signal transduction histidine kinase/CheY-like chemotaxis protein